MKSLLIVIFCLLVFGCSQHSANDGHDHGGHSPVNTSSVSVDHNSMNHSAMDHSKMESSPGAAEAPLVLQFIDTMIAHHQGAVDMAKLAEGRTENKQLQTFADGIINAQEREITEMRRWRSKWFRDEPTAINMNFPGMIDGMVGMDNKKLASLKSIEFDLEFVRQMIPHHEGAIKMADALKADKNYSDLTALAAVIKKDQLAEIEQMKKWQAEWLTQKTK